MSDDVRTRAFVDTNVFVYLFDAAAPAKQARARELLAQGNLHIVISIQVLQEFYVTVTRKLAKPMDPKTAEAAARDLAAFEVTPADAALVLRAIGRSRTSSLSLWDALIVESAIESNCEKLLSEDLQARQRFGDVTVENPFGGLTD